MKAEMRGIPVIWTVLLRGDDGDVLGTGTLESRLYNGACWAVHETNPIRVHQKGLVVEIRYLWQEAGVEFRKFQPALSVVEGDAVWLNYPEEPVVRLS